MRYPLKGKDEQRIRKAVKDIQSNRKNENGICWTLPANMHEYIKRHDGVNVAFNINSASACHGYAHIVHGSVVMSKLTRTCNRCGYDPLWNPDDSESKCIRHTYNNWRYDNVFVYSEERNPITLEEAFDDWLSYQDEKHNKPAVKKTYGQLGWR